MGKKIVVAGAGHGGLTAAYYLALAGFNVTVYEKKQESELGHEQSDSVHLDGFELSGIPIPEEYVVHRTPITFCVPGTDIEPITQYDNGESYTVEIDRKFLCGYLIGLAKDVGVQFRFGVNILSPIVLGSRVVGMHTDTGDIYADMIIDAAGLYSPLRTGLPDFMHIEKEPGEYEVLTSYRAYFNRNEDAGEPAYKYKVSLLPGENCGILWVITREKSVDVFIGQFSGLTDEKIAFYLDMIKKENPQVGETLLRGGKVADIPVRQPLGILVADGYAAVGDSAFMTIPVKGSGVGYSMRAGKLLAECIEADENGLYDCVHLWSYQTSFFKEIGSGACMLAVIKSLFPVLTLEDLEYALGQKLISSEDLALFGSEAGLLKIATSLKPALLHEKAKKLAGFQNLRKLLMKIAKGFTRYKLIEGKLKDEYRYESAAKWAKAYTELFEDLLKPGEADIEDTEKSAKEKPEEE